MLWPNTDNEDFKEALAAAETGESPNNVSAILTYQTGDVTFMWMGILRLTYWKRSLTKLSGPKCISYLRPTMAGTVGECRMQFLTRSSCGSS